MCWLIIPITSNMIWFVYYLSALEDSAFPLGTSIQFGCQMNFLLITAQQLPSFGFVALSEKIVGPYFLRAGSMWQKIEQWCDDENRSGTLGQEIKSSLSPGRPLDSNSRGRVQNKKKHQLSRQSLHSTLANVIPCWLQLLTPIASIHLQACLVGFRHTISSQVLGGWNLSLGMMINPSLSLLKVI